MYRVYLGNLDQQVTDDTLRDLFDQQGLTVSGILVKRGYGFVDCPDQNTFDQTIDRLNGINLLGSVLQVEPSTVSKRRRTNRIQIRNFPQQVTKEEVEQLVAAFGTVQRCDIASSSVENYVTVVYESADEAQKAFDQLDNYDFQGSILRVELTNNGSGRSRDGGRRGDADGRNAAYTLRILVASGYVGAIIGKKGETIRRITSESDVVRIDVHGKEQTGLLEKAIAIMGKPEAVSIACKEILKVMQQESAKANAGEVVLKILAEDRFCGRVIGKEGAVIKRIREETDTKIVVSNTQEMAAIYPDRIITVRGALDNLSQAEEIISKILRECFEKDAQQGVVPMGMMGYAPMHPGVKPQRFPMHSSYGGGPRNHAAGGEAANGPIIPSFYYIGVPNSAVGAIIGTAGSNIKQIMRDSGAYVSIEPKKDSDPNANSERSVTIKGGPEAFWRASYYVFEKMKIEGFAGNDDVRLRTFMKIPKSVAGRVIGKSGKNARDIELTTGAIIRVTEDSRAHEDEAMVEVFGNFMASQGAISRIRSVVSQVRSQPGSNSTHQRDSSASVMPSSDEPQD